MIYLDNAASTPMAPELLSELHYAHSLMGNAQSRQQTQLQKIIHSSQEKVSRLINAPANCIHFTSGATESITTAITGGSIYYRQSGKHIITFENEHAATLSAVHAMKQKGFDVSVLPINPDGSLNLAELHAAIQPDTVMVSVNHVCNETGYVQDLQPLSKLRAKHGFLLHIDASQSIGKSKLDIQAAPCDFVSLSAHKSHGPQGIGALYIATDRHVQPIVFGSNPVRSGTPPHAQIYLMGAAYQLTANGFEKNLRRVQELKDMLLSRLIIPYQLNSDGVPHILNLHFPSLSPEKLKTIQQHIFCQQSSSCHNGAGSHVLKARGFEHQHIMRSLRLSLSHYTKAEEVIKAADLLNRILSV